MKKKPFGWWYHKITCEIGWKLRNSLWFGWHMYYKHLNIMVGFYEINLYGEHSPTCDDLKRRFKKRYNTFFNRL